VTVLRRTSTRRARAVRAQEHKRLIDILDSRSQTVDALTKLDLRRLDVEIKVE